MAILLSTHHWQSALGRLGDHPIWPAVLSRCAALVRIPDELPNETASIRAAQNGDNPTEVLLKPIRYDFQTSRENRKWERHEQMIDVHVCVLGSEIISTIPHRLCAAASDYNPRSDTRLHMPNYRSEATHYIMNPGDIAVLFPGDVHRPLRKVKNIDHVEKAVFKVPVACWDPDILT